MVCLPVQLARLGTIRPRTLFTVLILAQVALVPLESRPAAAQEALEHKAAESQSLSSPRILPTDPTAAAALVRKVVDESITFFLDGKPNLEQRTVEFRQMIGRYTDLELSSADILGRFWGKAAPEEQATFKKLLIDYTIHSWLGDLGDLSPGQRVDLGSVNPSGDRMIVHSVATAPGDEPTLLEWQIATITDPATPEGRRLVITDVTMDGVSLLQTLRDDFTSIIRGKGGRFSALLDAMRAKLDKSP